MPVDAPLYPVGLVVAGRPVLVVGGGRVAARKVGDLVACGARVTVVAPEVVPALADRPTSPSSGGPTGRARRRTTGSW